jgi:hypothetical protein
LSSILYADTPIFRVNNKGLPFLHNFDHDSTGNIIVVWDDYRYTSDAGLVYLEQGAAIFIQKIDVEGNKIGLEKRIDEKFDLSTGNTRPDIAINKNNGDITIVWQERFDKPGGSRVSRIIYNIFNNNFRRKVFQVPLNNLDSVYQGMPEVIYLNNNNILITWLENDGKAQCYATVLDPDGVKIREKFKINTNTISANSVLSDKTASGFYFVWESYIQFFDNQGNPTTQIIDIISDNVNAVKTLNNEEILIVYRNQMLTELNGVIYNIDSSSFNYYRRIDDDTTGNKKSYANIAVNNNRDFIVSWSDQRNGSIYGVDDIYVQRYDMNKIPIGNNFKINHESSEINQNWPKIILFNDQIVITYTQTEQVKEIDSLPPGAVDPSAFKTYIAGTSQNFYDPLPGRIFGWQYLFDLVYTVGYPYPNPFIKTSDHCSIEVEFDKESLLSYEIYNIIGEKVFESSSKLLLEGEYTLTWNGKTNLGENVPSGVYIWVIHLEDNVITRKSTYIK